MWTAWWQTETGRLAVGGWQRSQRGAGACATAASTNWDTRTARLEEPVCLFLPARPARTGHAKIGSGDFHRWPSTDPGGSAPVQGLPGTQHLNFQDPSLGAQPKTAVAQDGRPWMRGTSAPGAAAAA